MFIYKNKNSTKMKFYITTAIAYPNSSPHLGHALEIIQADVAARFYRLLGKDVFFQTGTDEHGIKNWQTAEKQGIDIKEFLNKNVAVFKELYKKLNISHNLFIRTTDKKRHFKGCIKAVERTRKGRGHLQEAVQRALLQRL
ncbi:MAG: class I tRNA ligase family protein [archaeon]